MPTRVPTLLYHDVVDDARWSASGFQGGDADIYKLETHEFVAHLERLHKSGRQAARFDFPGLDPQKHLLITFDDGGISAVEKIAPALERFGWRGHFFMTTGWLGAPGFMGADHLRDLAARGHVVGSHSETHPLRMSSCSPRELLREWTSSTERLADVLGVRPTVASIPGGAFSAAVAEAAGRAGIRVLFTSEPTAHVWWVGSVCCFGRFTVWRGMSADKAATLGRGQGLEAVKQRVSWDSKKIAKAVLGPAYQRLREQLLSTR